MVNYCTFFIIIVVLFILFGDSFESVNVRTYCCWHIILQWPGFLMFDLVVGIYRQNKMKQVCNN